MAASKGIRKHVSRTTLRPDGDENFDLSQHDENNRVRTDQRTPNIPPELGTNFTEAVGKVVAYINLFNNPPEWQGLEVHFTDGTSLHFEFLTNHTRIRSKFRGKTLGPLLINKSTRVTTSHKDLASVFVSFVDAEYLKRVTPRLKNGYRYKNLVCQEKLVVIRSKRGRLITVFATALAFGYTLNLHERHRGNFSQSSLRAKFAV